MLDHFLVIHLENEQIFCVKLMQTTGINTPSRFVDAFSSIGHHTERQIIIENLSEELAKHMFWALYYPNNASPEAQLWTDEELALCNSFNPKDHIHQIKD